MIRLVANQLLRSFWPSHPTDQRYRQLIDENITLVASVSFSLVDSSSWKVCTDS